MGPHLQPLIKLKLLPMGSSAKHSMIAPSTLSGASEEAGAWRPRDIRLNVQCSVLAAGGDIPEIRHSRASLDKIYRPMNWSA